MFPPFYYAAGVRSPLWSGSKLAPRLLIFPIMKRLQLLAFLALTSLLHSVAAAQAHDAPSTSSMAVVNEMNFARQNPMQYAQIIGELRSNYQGNLFVRPGHIAIRTKEGIRAIDDAIRFLRSASPRAPLTFSAGMSRAAADHCAEQAGGGMSHRGRDGSSTADRISRYGTWSGVWGENLSCGRSSPREIVVALIVDDGLRSRKHRANIFSSNFNYAGAAIGRHATYSTICSIEFAGGYAETGRPDTGKLIARNF
jgi:uncharacterized protein YkwD